MRQQDDNVNYAAGEPDDVLELVHALMHDYRTLQYRILRDEPYEITHMDSKVLGFFGRHPATTQSDLVQHSGRDKAQIARLIKGLRDRGLLAGEADASDRRSVRLSLTADGQALQSKLRQQAQRLSAQAVAGLTSSERKQLLDLLRRVKGNLGAGGPGTAR